MQLKKELQEESTALRQHHMKTISKNKVIHQKRYALKNRTPGKVLKGPPSQEVRKIKHKLNMEETDTPLQITNSPYLSPRSQIPHAKNAERIERLERQDHALRNTLNTKSQATLPKQRQLPLAPKSPPSPQSHSHHTHYHDILKPYANVNVLYMNPLNKIPSLPQAHLPNVSPLSTLLHSNNNHNPKLPSFLNNVSSKYINFDQVWKSTPPLHHNPPNPANKHSHF